MNCAEASNRVTICLRGIQFLRLGDRVAVSIKLFIVVNIPTVHRGFDKTGFFLICLTLVLHARVEKVGEWSVSSWRPYFLHIYVRLCIFHTGSFFFDGPLFQNFPASMALGYRAGISFDAGIMLLQA